MNLSELRDQLKPEIALFDSTKPVEDAFTPPASWYTQSDFHDLEKETVFKNSWLMVGRLDQVKNPGDYFTGIVNRRPFIVTLDKEDQKLKAFYNVCSHHGTCVAKGEGNSDKFVCPYHGWTYASDGKLKKAPNAGAIQDLRKKNLDLKSIPIHSSGPFVFLFFGTNPTEFNPKLTAEFEKQGLDKLNFVRQITYTLNCNWKVFVDNYLDGGYHVPHMHKGLTDQLDINSYNTQLFENYSIQSCDSTKDQNTDSKADFKERLGGSADYTWVYPNLMINRYGKWMDTNIAIPLDKDRCQVIFDYYYDGEISEELLERSLNASNIVQDEDTEICDMVQIGLESGAYNGGIYAPQFEAPMLHFHKLLNQDYLH